MLKMVSGISLMVALIARCLEVVWLGKKSVDGGEIGRAGGDWWGVNVENGEWDVVDGGSDCEVLGGCVVGKEGVGVDGGEMDRVMDEDDETTPA